MHQARFSKCARLLKAVDYSKVFDRSVRSSDNYFTVLARPNGLKRPRLGLAISKKKARLAVDRNRLKRITRESFRISNSIYNADYVIMANVKGVRAVNKDLFQSLDTHWQRLAKKCENF